MKRISAVFDYFFNSCSQDEIENVKKLISEDEQCSAFHKNLKNALAPLDSIKDETCPEELVEMLMGRIKKSESQVVLEKLLEKESTISNDNVFVWNRIGQITAGLLLVAMLAATYFPATNRMRTVADSIACKHNMANIGIAMQNYAADNAGLMPLAESPTKSWWKVGSQRADEYSNTRNAWLMVKDGYANIKDFQCPARPVLSEVKLKKIDICDYQKDFPHKEFINYSFPIISGNVQLDNVKHKILAADSNPLFEENCLEKQSFFKTVRLDEGLRNSKSYNHNGAGQNILLIDNSVKFTTSNFYKGDNFYTIEGVNS